MHRPEVLDLPNLPDEIWSEIFSRLPLDGRKSIRRCCRRFYELCNCRRILEGERIVFEGNFNVGPAISSLSSSDRQTWNIELRRIYFNEDACNFVELFFRQQGSKVRSLTFYKCVVQPLAELSIVKFVVTRCPYLREITFVFDSSDYSKCFYRQHFLDGLNILNALKVVRGTVETFTLKIPKGSYFLLFHLTNDHFLRIFDIFPNIKNLRLSIRVPRDFDEPDKKVAEADFNSQAITFSCICQQLLKMRHQLVKLNLRFMSRIIDDPSTRSWLRIGDMEAPNLKELSLNGIFVMEDSLIAFPRLKHLTHFDCVLPIQGEVHLNFVPLLLNAATELQTLKVRTHYKFSMSEECFRALVRSRLVTLSFYLPSFDCLYTEECCLLSVYCASTDASFDRSIAPNRTLRQLKMGLGDGQTWYLFSRYFTRLENFVSIDFQPQTLLRLFESLPRLSNLVLDGSKGIETLQQQYSDPASYRLDNLTCLKLSEITSAVSEFLLGKFICPKLKSLEITQMGSEENFNSNALSSAIGKFSQLELLDIRCKVEFPFRRWLDLANALPKLRSIVVSSCDSRVLHDKQYRYLFQVRPSLRTICIIMSDVDVVYYLKDIITNSVEKRCRRRKRDSVLPLTIFL